MIKKQNKVSKNLLLSLFLLTTPLITALVTSHSTTSSNTNTVLYLHELEPVRSAGRSTLDKIIQQGNTIVIFYENWCGPCKRMTPIFEEVATTLPSVTFIKVKRELYRSLFDFYNLNTVPAILFFKNGKLIKIQPSSVSKTELMKLIKQVYGA
jgi:thioredoxin 1